jgi:hypothetical protein
MDYYTRLAVVLLEQKYVSIFTTVSPEGGLRGDDANASARACECSRVSLWRRLIHKTKYDLSQQRL